MNAARNGSFIVIVSVLLSLLLTVLPLPDWLNVARPWWVALTLMYWALALPHRYGIASAFVCGLLLDVIAGSLLGLNALLLSLLVYFCLSFYSRLRMFTRAMQAAVVLALIGVALVLRLWILNSVERQSIAYWYWLPCLSSAAIWFVWFPLLRWLRRRFALS